VEHHLSDLADADPALVVQLPRAPGTKEARWAHRLCGDTALERMDAAAGFSGDAAHIDGESSDRIDALEAEVKALRRAVDWLTEELATFKRQFE
jgi:hypothetical protein